jgi:hypothetical protein
MIIANEGSAAVICDNVMMWRWNSFNNSPTWSVSYHIPAKICAFFGGVNVQCFAVMDDFGNLIRVDIQ